MLLYLTQCLTLLFAPSVVSGAFVVQLSFQVMEENRGESDSVDNGKHGIIASKYIHLQPFDCSFSSTAARNPHSIVRLEYKPLFTAFSPPFK